MIDPAPLGLPNRHEREEGAGLVALQQRIGQAEAFVTVTLGYSHSFSAVLKFLIDSVHDQRQPKPVAFVSYGGISRAAGGAVHLQQPRSLRRP